MSNRTKDNFLPNRKGFQFEPCILASASKAPHKNTFVLLHGTSSSGYSFGEEIIRTFQVPNQPLSNFVSPLTTSLPKLLPDTQFIFPSGSARPTTVFDGKFTTAWFDIADFGDRNKNFMDQLEGLSESVTYLGKLISEEAEKDLEMGQSKPIVVGGLSMGCAMSIILLLSGELERLGLIGNQGVPVYDGTTKAPEVGDRGNEGAVVAIVGMSGWLPLIEAIRNVIFYEGKVLRRRYLVRTALRNLLKLQPWNVTDESKAEPEVHPTQREIKIWLGHGMHDSKVKLSWGEQMRDLLRDLGYPVYWFQYPELGHSSSPEELIDIARFVNDVVSD